MTSFSSFFQKHTFIAGTLILTSTGLISRVLGFFYRIFLSRTIGAEGLGLYQMVYPVFGICFALCAGSIQTAVSRFVAAQAGKEKLIFKTGLVISFSISFILAFFISCHSEFLAARVLMEPRCAPLLPFMAFSIPFSAIHACINGYYYGMQKTKIPALAQVLEQTIRIGAVFFIAHLMIEQGMEITVQLAVLGHLIGEMASCLFVMLSFSLFTPPDPQKSHSISLLSGIKDTAPPLMTLALPLMGNRLVLNLLASAEAIWIPNQLQMSGLTNEQAFSIYGVLTGMAMPFILFPSAITNSMAVLLLPTVAEAQSAGNEGRISITVSMSLRYSLYMGILCVGIFTIFGGDLGTSVFHDPDSGRFITILAWLCPFWYLATTTGSILNGLGKTSTTFLQTATAFLIRLAFVLFLIPKFGILAYLWGMLSSELLLALLHLYSLKRLISFSWNSLEMIIKPAFCLFLSLGIYWLAKPQLTFPPAFPLFFETAAHIGIVSVCYVAILLFLHKK